MPNITLDRFATQVAIKEACERGNAPSVLKIVRDGMTAHAQYSGTADAEIYAATTRQVARLAAQIEAIETECEEEFTGDYSGYARAVAKRIGRITIQSE